VGSIDPLPIEEIRRRLREVYENARHLRCTLELDSPHNQVLRLKDIARYSHIGESLLYAMRFSEPPRSRTIDPEAQEALSRFFQGWDSGRLVKARTVTGWYVINSALAQVAAATREKRPDIGCRIELTAAGPRLKGV
jgi:hypothetical protein